MRRDQLSAKQPVGYNFRPLKWKLKSYIELLEWIVHFRAFEGKKILLIRDLKMGRFVA